MRGSRRRIDVFTVATGRYLEFWRQLAFDVDLNMFPHDDVRVTVFTDRSTEAKKVRLDRIHVRVVPTESLGWPDATLRRYELMSPLLDESDADIAVHLDADLRIPFEMGEELDAARWTNGLAFVRHPGFTRRLSGYFSSRPPMRTIAGELQMRARNGGALGTWEETRYSEAFVPQSRRRVYVCGGVWFGSGEALSGMCRELSRRTKKDLQEGRIARWHDESYLNWYAAFNHVTVLGAEYCWAPQFARMIPSGPRIIAVEKGADWLRTPTL